MTRTSNNYPNQGNKKINQMESPPGVTDAYIVFLHCEHCKGFSHSTLHTLQCRMMVSCQECEPYADILCGSELELGSFRETLIHVLLFCSCDRATCVHNRQSFHGGQLNKCGPGV